MADGDLIRKGEPLFVQGDIPSSLYLLQSGTLEVLCTGDEYQGLDKSIIISKSRRMGLLRGKVLLAGFSELMEGPYRFSLRAVEDCQVTRYPLARGGFRAIASADTARSITMLRQLFNTFNTVSADISRLSSLFINVSRLNDNMALLYRILSGAGAPDELNSRSQSLFSNYSSAGGENPSQMDARFLLSDNSRFLRKKYEAPGEPLESFLSMEQCTFMRDLLKLDASLVQPVLAADSTLSIRMFSLFDKSLSRSFERLASLADGIHRELESLIGDDNSWASYLVKTGGMDELYESGRLAPDFLKNFLSLIGKVNSVFEEVCLEKIIDSYPVVRLVHQKVREGMAPKPKEEAAASSSSEAVPSFKPSRDATKRSIHQIFEFALVDKEFQNRFFKLLNDFKNMKNPLDSESEPRKVRRHITKMYWDLYKQAYIRSKAESSVPLSVRMMLQFGFLDEDLLEEAQVAELSELLRIRESSGDMPVYYEHEFLNLIQTGSESPSINEMGITYEEYLREQGKRVHKKGEEGTSFQVDDENLRLLVYEIDQRVTSSTAVCSGSTATAFPILNAYAMRGSLKGAYVTKSRINEIIQMMRGTDFSAFYRETVLKLGEARELIMEEVLPYIILLPTYGSKSMLWQELDGNNRRSRGRIVVPVFFAGELDKSLAHTVACFRWELNRSIKGAMWGDPIEGGLTGEYFDYMNNYKKNNKLSAEAREKLKDRFKSLRTNRDRFADDYLMWVFYEKDGIMKLNNVVREMFYRNIPFKKEIRERLENMPAFAQIATRYKNVSNRTFASFERRFKKYATPDNTYPESIQRYLDFLNL